MTAQETAEGAGRELKEHPALEVLVRGGLVGYGALYLLLGWLALQLALGDREGRVTKSGALHQFAGETWGMILLWAACVGFVAVAIYEAIGDRYSVPAQIGNYGWTLLREGRAADARSYLLRAADLFDAMGLADYADRHRRAAQAATSDRE